MMSIKCWHDSDVLLTRYHFTDIIVLISVRFYDFVMMKILSRSWKWSFTIAIVFLNTHFHIYNLLFKIAMTAYIYIYIFPIKFEPHAQEIASTERAMGITRAMIPYHCESTRLVRCHAAPFGRRNNLRYNKCKMGGAPIPSFSFFLFSFFSFFLFWILDDPKVSP